MKRLTNLILLILLSSLGLDADSCQTIELYGGPNAGGYAIFNCLSIEEVNNDDAPDQLDLNCTEDDFLLDFLENSPQSWYGFPEVKVPLERNRTYRARVTYSIFADNATLDILEDLVTSVPLELEYKETHNNNSPSNEMFTELGSLQFSYNDGSSVAYYGSVDFQIGEHTVVDFGNGWRPASIEIKTLFPVNTEYNLSFLNSRMQVAPAVYGILDDEVPIQDVSYTPAMPMLVLHDPPGDKSYATWSNTVEHCTNIAWSVADETAVGGWASVKVGAAGSVGVLGIVSTDYEVYAQASGSVQMDLSTNEYGETERCLSTTTTWATDGESGNITGSKGDLFIGKATELSFGSYRVADFTCDGPVTDTRLVMAPTGVETEFAYTEDHIRNSVIPDLQATMAQNPNDVQTARQLQVWQDALAENEAVLNGTVVETKNFSAGGGGFQEITTSVTELSTIETTVDLDMGLAAEVGATIGGAGASGGASINLRTSTSQSSTNISSNSNTISYFLGDDDTGGSADEFQVSVINDGRFGTPAFRLNEAASRTSCPYEGGYQMDDPRLSFEDGSGLGSFTGPVGEAIVIPLEICNDSDYNREYYLRQEGNGSGLLMQAEGTNLNSTTEGHPFSNIPANDCRNTLLIVESPTASLTSFEGISLYLYACTEGDDGEATASIVYMDVYFGEEVVPSDFDAACAAMMLAVDGSLHGPFSNANATADLGEAAISPAGTGCEMQDGWCSDASTIENSVWFTFIAPASGEMTVSTCDLADFDTQIAVYRAGGCEDYSSYELIAANDDGPAACSTDYDSFLSLQDLTPGATYHLLVDGYLSASGEFSVQLTATGVATSIEQKVESSFSLYPNPCSNVLNLELSEEMQNFSLYNAAGQEVYREDIRGNMHGEVYSIDLPELPNAFYLARVEGKTGSQSIKVLIQQ